MVGMVVDFLVIVMCGSLYMKLVWCTCTGLAAACSGLMTNCFPLECRMWSESGLHATEYTGVPKNNTQPVTSQIIAG